VSEVGIYVHPRLGICMICCILAADLIRGVFIVDHPLLMERAFVRKGLSCAAFPSCNMTLVGLTCHLHFLIPHFLSS